MVRILINQVGYISGDRKRVIVESDGEKVDSFTIIRDRDNKEVYDLTNDIDSSIRMLAGVKFNSNLDTDKGSTKSYNEECVAKTIVYMAELLNLYYNFVNSIDIDKKKDKIIA